MVFPVAALLIGALRGFSSPLPPYNRVVPIHKAYSITILLDQGRQDFVVPALAMWAVEIAEFNNGHGGIVWAKRWIVINTDIINPLWCILGIATSDYRS